MELGSIGMILSKLTPKGQIQLTYLPLAILSANNKAL